MCLMTSGIWLDIMLINEKKLFVSQSDLYIFLDRSKVKFSFLYKNGIIFIEYYFCFFSEKLI